MSADGLAEFRDRYEALMVTACEWRAMHTEPETLAATVFSVLAEKDAPDLRTAYQVLDEVVFDSYVRHSDGRSILDRLRGQVTAIPNAPKDSPEEAKLRDAVSRLRRRDRDLLQRAYWDELSESELAEVDGVDVPTVVQRREQALNNYRRLIARLSPSSDPGMAAKLLRSIKPGIRTRWE
ncbi:MAG: hypothetical protein KIT69_02660 [Propionibacteriaceae bacterium]|nr:hypothetical protein [Propionibacteriaceae bacterium]